MAKKVYTFRDGDFTIKIKADTQQIAQNILNNNLIEPKHFVFIPKK